MSLALVSVCAAHAAPTPTAAPKKSGLTWVSIDMNGRKNEVAQVSALAGGAQNMVHLKNFADLDKFLAAHPDARLGPIVLSGHSDGTCFFGNNAGDGDWSTAALKAVADKYQQAFSTVRVMFTMGCMSGSFEVMRGWVRALPNVRAIGGFDGIAPLNTQGSPRWLTHAYSAALKLPERASEAHVKMAALTTGAGFNTSAFGSVASAPDGRKLFLYSHHGRDIRSIDISAPDPCLPRLDALSKLLGKYKSVNGFLASFSTPDSSGNLPPLPNSEHGLLRQVYAQLPPLESCDGLTRTQPLYRRLFAELEDDEEATESLEPRDLKKTLIALIHGDLLARNFVTCSRPYLEALKNFWTRCPKWSGSSALAKVTQDLTKLLAAPPAQQRQVLGNLSSHVSELHAWDESNYRDEAEMADDLALQVTDTLLPPSDLPEGSWVAAVTPTSPMCLRQAASNAVAKSLATLRCDQTITAAKNLEIFRQKAPTSGFWEVSLRTAKTENDRRKETESDNESDPDAHANFEGHDSDENSSYETNSSSPSPSTPAAGPVSEDITE